MPFTLAIPAIVTATGSVWWGVAPLVVGWAAWPSGNLFLGTLWACAVASIVE